MWSPRRLHKQATFELGFKGWAEMSGRGKSVALAEGACAKALGHKHTLPFSMARRRVPEGQRQERGP